MLLHPKQIAPTVIGRLLKFPSPQVGSELERLMLLHPKQSVSIPSSRVGTLRILQQTQIHNKVSIPSSRVGTLLEFPTVPETEYFHPLKSGRNQPWDAASSAILQISIPSSRVGTFLRKSFGRTKAEFPSPQVGSELAHWHKCIVRHKVISIPSSRVGTHRNGYAANLPR